MMMITMRCQKRERKQFIPPSSIHDTADIVGEKGYCVKVLHSFVNLMTSYLPNQHKTDKVAG